MRILEQRRGYFRGTHKTCTIEIERDREYLDRHFYIRVQTVEGGHLYDGWSPEGITTIKAAKREALRGAML